MTTVDLDAIRKRDKISKSFCDPSGDYVSWIGDADRRALLAYVDELREAMDGFDCYWCRGTGNYLNTGKDCEYCAGIRAALAKTTSAAGSTPDPDE